MTEQCEQDRVKFFDSIIQAGGKYEDNDALRLVWDVAWLRGKSAGISEAIEILNVPPAEKGANS